jgi:hypothetical protein
MVTEIERQNFTIVWRSRLTLSWIVGTLTAACGLVAYVFQYIFA